MSLHVYECPRGHVTEILEGINEERLAGMCCTHIIGNRCCFERLYLSAAVMTAPPKFVKGSGGFYSPTTPE